MRLSVPSAAIVVLLYSFSSFAVNCYFAESDYCSPLGPKSDASVAQATVSPACAQAILAKAAAVQEIAEQGLRECTENPQQDCYQSYDLTNGIFKVIHAAKGEVLTPAEASQVTNYCNAKLLNTN